MPLGFDRDLNVINSGDSAEIYAFITDERDVPVPEEDLLSVEFTIQHPDGSKVTETGEIQEDGKGFLRYSTTTEIGEYKTIAQFTFLSGALRSVRADFEVIDPFNPPTPDDTDIIALGVWNKLQDLFDSEEGGPWLQDVTMSTFKKERIEKFIAEGLFDVNSQPPATNAVIGEFVIEGVAQPHAPLLIQGVLVAVIRHLIRSYVEQPLPTGGQIVYQDRRDYLQRWQSVLQTEEQHYLRLLALWKRQFLGAPGSKILVSSKAGRLLPAPLRTRNVGRGFY